MTRAESYCLDLITDLMVGRITLPELKEAVEQAEEGLRFAQKRVNDVTYRRKLDAALGVKPKRAR